MTKDQKIEAIHAWCIKANPDIVSLKSGCRVLLKKGVEVTFISSKPMGHDGMWVYCKEENGNITKFSYNASFKDIIGRDIRLADVLLALKQHPDCDTSWEYEVASIIIWEFSRKWNLRADNLNDQSDETIDFIQSLIPTV